jgi:hypothetical protein
MSAAIILTLYYNFGVVKVSSFPGTFLCGGIENELRLFAEVFPKYDIDGGVPQHVR